MVRLVGKRACRFHNNNKRCCRINTAINHKRRVTIGTSAVIRLLLYEISRTMSNEKTQPARSQPAVVAPKGTKTIFVIPYIILECSPYVRASSPVVLEVPSDATEEEIIAMGTSVWKSLAPPETWSVNYLMDDIWMEDVEFEFMNKPDDVRVDARLVRTIEGQLVALAN